MDNISKVNSALVLTKENWILSLLYQDKNTYLLLEGISRFDQRINRIIQNNVDNKKFDFNKPYRVIPYIISKQNALEFIETVSNEKPQQARAAGLHSTEDIFAQFFGTPKAFLSSKPATDRGYEWAKEKILNVPKCLETFKLEALYQEKTPEVNDLRQRCSR